MRPGVDVERAARWVVGACTQDEVEELERRVAEDPALATEVAALRALAAKTRLLRWREVVDATSGR